MSLLDPLSHALAAVLAAVHTALTSLGADPASGTTWLLCVAAVVVVVRLALLPLAIHARSRPSCLPLLLQLPVWLALYHLLAGVASGTPMGAMDGELVASLGAATLFGVSLASRGYGSHLLVVAGLAGAAALLGYVTQRYLVVPVPPVGELVPAISAVGVLVAGGFVPVLLLAYWVCNAVWTLGQTAALRPPTSAPGRS